MEIKAPRESKFAARALHSARPALQELQATPTASCALPRAPSSSAVPRSENKRKLHQNGYEKTPKVPSFKPYKPPPSSKKHKTNASTPGHIVPSTLPLEPIRALGPPTPEQWDRAARRLVGADGSLRFFQQNATTALLARRDVIVIAPTGIGKSLLFLLPLLFYPSSIVLVVTPLRSLGIEQSEE